MNFFEYQDRAHRNSQTLIWLFIFSVCCIIFSIYIAAIISFGLMSKGKATIALWEPELFILVAIPTLLVIGSGTCYKLLSLRQGGAVIARDLGGRLVASDTTNPLERQLLNVVEEMAIASGISVPAVYILDDERSINAFAAGFTPNDAAIGVTLGCITHLSRDELQGVIGHEFSHILNGDMRMNLRLVGLLHGILLIYLAGRILLRTNNFSSNKKANQLAIFGFALIIIGSIGMLCGRLIKSAVSRQREFLADASSVQFTRNPAGLAGALRKIANHQLNSLIQSPHAESNSHLFFGSALQFNFLSEVFATHPPLEQRINRLEPSKGKSVAPIPSNYQQNDSLVMGLAGKSTPQPASKEKIEANPGLVVAQVGVVAPEHFAYAQALLAKLPESIQTGLRDRQNAIAIVYSLSLDTQNTPIRDRQIAWLRQVQPPEVIETTLKYYPEIAQLDPKMRLPLLDLTIPALRGISATECQQLFKCVNGLAKADGDLSLAEFVLYLVLWHRLQPCINPNREHKIQYTNLAQVWPDCLILLSALSQVGQTSQDAVAYAFRSGAYRLPGVSQQTLPETPPAFNLGQLHQSLKRLGLASGKIKQSVVDACAHTVLLDNVVTVQEADVLRAIVINLDCPLPPFLNPRASQRKK